MKGNKKLRELIDLIFETFHVTVEYYPNGEEMSCYTRTPFEEEGIYNPLMPESFHITNWQDCILDDVPKILCTPFYENYIGIKVKEKKTQNGILLIGPSLYNPVQTDTIKSHCSFLSSKKAEQLLYYFSHLPVLSFEQLNHISRMVYFMIYERYLPIDVVLEKNFYDINAAITVQGKFARDFSIARQNDQFHHSYEWEKTLFDCLRRGDTKSVLFHLNRPADGLIGILAENDPIRSEKNRIISIAAVAARVAIEEGVPAPICYGLNDSYVQLVEAAATLDELRPLMVTMLCDISNQVLEFKEQNFSSLVKGCLDYIFVNLYEKFTVSEISNELKCNVNYLSRIFKHEVGKTISEFTTYERIEEAKRLLQFSKLSIIDIAAMMQFNDQSHFTRVFRKVAGMTPKKYRDQY